MDLSNQILWSLKAVLNACRLVHLPLVKVQTIVEIYSVLNVSALNLTLRTLEILSILECEADGDPPDWLEELENELDIPYGVPPRHMRAPRRPPKLAKRCGDVYDIGDLLAKNTAANSGMIVCPEYSPPPLQRGTLNHDDRNGSPGSTSRSQGILNNASSPTHESSIQSSLTSKAAAHRLARPPPRKLSQCNKK